MKNKLLYTDFSDTKTIIEGLLQSKELKQAIKRKNLFDMWKKAVGEKFYEKSKPYSMMGKTLVIACQNSTVAQELVLRKLQILTTLEPYLKALNLTVKDIKFDAKRWSMDEN